MWYTPDMTGNNDLNEVGTLLPVSRYLKIFRQSWLSGVLFILFLSIALVMLRVDMYHSRNHSSYLEIIGRIHAHTQNLVIASREALRGDKSAFIRLQGNLDQLNRYSVLLQHGGTFQRETFPAITELLRVDLLGAFPNAWYAQENRIRLLLKNQEALVGLVEILKRIDSTNNVLQEKLQKLSTELTGPSHSSDTVVVVETVRILVQFITGSVSSALQSGIQVSREIDRPTGGGQNRLQR